MKFLRVWMAVCLMTVTVSAFAMPPNRKLAEIRSQLALEYARLGNMAVAVQTVNEAIEADASYAPAFLTKAYLQSQLGQDGDAEQSYLKALQLDPGNPEANNNYGFFLCEHQHPQTAIDFFNKALANPLYQTPQTAYLNLGRCSAKLGQVDKANDYLLSALRIVPDYQPALRELAVLHLDQGNAKLAAFYFDRLMRTAGTAGPLPADTLWLGVQIARRNGDRAHEAEYGAILKNRFPDSKETQLLLSGS